MSEIQPSGTGSMTVAQTPAATPSVDDLQFQRAEPAAGATSRQCTACKRSIAGTYFQAAGHIVCSTCADRLRDRTMTPPPIAMGRATLMGAGAALAGWVIFSA